MKPSNHHRHLVCTRIAAAACAAYIGAAACSGSSGGTPAREDPAAARPRPPAPPDSAASAAALPPAISTVPAKLAEVAARFGVTMANEWEWTELERMQTRFDWSGRPKGKKHEARWSFWMNGDEVPSITFLLPQVVHSAALNLTQDKACQPFEQPVEIAQIVGADRVITVCFEPAPYVSEQARFGVMHGLLRGDVLVLVIVLANDRTGTVPLPDDIGGRFRP